MKIEKVDAYNWRVDDAEIWVYHTQRGWYCWACGSWTCKHIKAYYSGQEKSIQAEMVQMEMELST